MNRLTEDHILVGVVLSAHGVDGRISAEALSDDPARFSAGSKLLTDSNGELTIESASWHKGRLLLKISGIDDRSAAERLRGLKLLADRRSSTPLPDGQYYHYQLLGLEVYERGQLLGTLTDILSYTANDVYVTATPEGQQILIPALKSVVKKVDLSDGRIEVELPEGLR
ncbi:MAG: ribosome maturation factor RimM [Bacillota bacterium]|nr:ribosome maturation factor RimM [Bacillota bacterium]